LARGNQTIARDLSGRFGEIQTVLVADYIIQRLEEIGVTHVFTVSGGGSIWLCDALARAKKLRYVCNHHEQASGYAAEGYARISGKLGVTIVTSGPGGTNAVSSCAASWLDHVPHLFISGQSFLHQTIEGHPGLRQMGLQEINIIDIVRPITKYAVMVKRPQDIFHTLSDAIYEATSGRPGPCWLDIPGNIQNASI